MTKQSKKSKEEFFISLRQEKEKKCIAYGKTVVPYTLQMCVPAYFLLYSYFQLYKSTKSAFALFPLHFTFFYVTKA